MEGATKEDWSQFRAIKALRDKVAALPKVKQIYATAGDMYAAYRC
jgi:ABC-type sugar transport system substrate-binding protein